MSGTAAHGGAQPGPGAPAVLRNRPFLLLWLSQVATQIGANMVLYGLTVLIFQATSSQSAISALFLTFLVPAVVLSAVAGVFVDRVDRRLILVLTNLLRAGAIAGIYLVGGNLAAILALNIVLSILTVFFTPAEAAMIPVVVPRDQLVSANGLFTLTLNGAFALGYALLGPLIVTLFGPERLILMVTALYVVAAGFCWTLPPSRATGELAPGGSMDEAESAMRQNVAAFRDGIAYIRANPTISWSLIYLGIAASLVGVVGVLGPAFAKTTLGLDPKDLIVVVLPLGLGIVFGILLLNSYGRYLVRRRAIEGGLISLGILLLLLTIAGPISRALRAVDPANQLENLSGLTSLVAVVVVMAFFAGIAYGVVAISSQTQLQEDIPEAVRGRVFGVLNMLVSVSSFLPIILAGTLADLLGTTNVILAVAVGVLLAGVASVVLRGPMAPGEEDETAETMVEGSAIDSFGVTVRHRPEATQDEVPKAPSGPAGPAAPTGARPAAGAKSSPADARRPATGADRGAERPKRRS